MSEVRNTMSVAWDDEENLRSVHLQIDYAIEEYNPGDNVTGPCGGGVEIECVNVIDVFWHDSSNQEWWMHLSTAKSACNQLPVAAMIHLIDCYEQSTEYEKLEDACREHAAREV